MMEAIEYLKEKSIMTKNCTMVCTKCPLCACNNTKKEPCTMFEVKYPQEAIKIVHEWYKKHSAKTRKEKFLEIFPKTKMNEFGLPEGVCCLNIGLEETYDDCEKYSGDCISCWNMPYEE